MFANTSKVLLSVENEDGDILLTMPLSAHGEKTWFDICWQAPIMECVGYAYLVQLKCALTRVHV